MRRSSLRRARSPPGTDRCPGHPVRRPAHAGVGFPAPLVGRRGGTLGRFANRERGSWHEHENGTVVVARDVTRRYGEGETAVDALRGVSVEVPRGRLTAVMGPSGSGQVDADAHPGGPRQADVRLGRDRRDGDHDPEGLRPDKAPASPHRLRLPVLQPPADAHGGGEHHAARSRSPARSPRTSTSTS